MGEVWGHTMIGTCPGTSVKRARTLASGGGHEESKRRRTAASPVAESTGPMIIVSFNTMPHDPAAPDTTRDVIL